MQESRFTPGVALSSELAARTPGFDVRIDWQDLCPDRLFRLSMDGSLTPALAQGYPDEKGSLHYFLLLSKKLGRPPMRNSVCDGDATV